MKLRDLQLSDLQLKTCTRWQAPDGTVYLPLTYTIPFYQTLAANAAALADVEVGTHPEYGFLCKGITYTGVTPGTLLQIQWPDGRFLSAAPMDFFSFIGTGKRGRLVDPFKYLRPASKIRLNLDNSLVGSISNVELFFEGVILKPMVPNG